MGAKTWMLVYSDGDAPLHLKGQPALDRPASEALARRLFPGERLAPLEGDGSLCLTSPPDDEVHVGCFPGVAVVAAREFGADRPSQLPARFLEGAPGTTVHLHAMHSVVDWFAYATWVNGRLQRSLSVSPDSGVLEDVGAPAPFEAPFWAGQRPAVDPDEEPEGYPLPFHPLELGEAALLALFGYQLEWAGGAEQPGPVDPEAVPLLRLGRRSRWRFW